MEQKNYTHLLAGIKSWDWKPVRALMAAALLATGCGGGDDYGAPEASIPSMYDLPDNQVPEIVIEDPEAPAPAPDPSMAAANTEPQELLPSDEKDETEEDIKEDFDSMLYEANDALESFYDDNGRFPNSMKELLEQGELTMAPRPPAGKKLAFDRTQRKFVFVDK